MSLGRDLLPLDTTGEERGRLDAEPSFVEVGRENFVDRRAQDGPPV